MSIPEPQPAEANNAARRRTRYLRVVRHSGDARLAEAAETVGRRSWAGDVRSVINTLPSRQRSALRLVYFERMTHSQAAEQLDISPRALAADLAQAMRAIAAEIALPAGG